MRPRRGRALSVPLAVAGVLLLPGCTSFADTVAAEGEVAAAPTPVPPEEDPDAEVTCPAERAEPDPDRPRVGLDLRLEDDLATVTGTETVVFTPDLDTDELVFRLVPNGPDSAAAGNRLVVDAVRGDDVATGRYEAAGAVEPGGLYVVELDGALAAGDTTEVELDFRLSLGSRGFDRFGTDRGVSWWASGAPLLAWEPGVGWAKDPFVALSGETTTSPAADTTIRVSAPEALTVLMTGEQDEPSASRDGRRIWTSAEPVARDVAVAVGEFTTVQSTSPGGVLVTTGVLPGGDLGAGQLADWTAAAIADVERHLGPFPYETLSVPLLPDYGGGIEYPSLILQASPSRSVLVHEVAHMWFYGMVGNSQFRDPWLDEAFATYAEAVVNPESASLYRPALGAAGPVGGAMDQFADDRQYFVLVYAKGGAALLAAREAAGPEAFDAALRCYVDASAWSIATPADLGAVFADVPEAVRVLAEAQALGQEDLPG
jgi:hypothetical protein